MEFAELAALVRMSHKYHVEDVHARAMQHLKLYFTNDLTTWDAAGADVFERREDLGEPRDLRALLVGDACEARRLLQFCDVACEGGARVRPTSVTIASRRVCGPYCLEMLRDVITVLASCC